MRHFLHQLSWIVHYRVRAALRYLGANAFVLALLGPLIVGALFLIVDRGVLLIRDTVQELVVTGGGALPGSVSLVGALLLTALGLGAAFDELYPKRDPRVLLDILPVTPLARLVVAWLACFVGNGLAWGGLGLLASLLGPDGPEPPALAVLLQLALVFVPLTSMQLIVVLVAVRARLFRAGPVLVAGAIGVALVVAAPRTPALAAIALAPWLAAAGQMEQALFRVLLPEGLPGHVWTGMLAWATTSVVLAVLYGVLTVRWQRRDRVRAHALRSPGSGALGRWLLARTTWLGRPIAAQVVRDLLLVWRRFSPIVYVAAALTVLANLMVLFVLPTLGVNAFWHGRLALLGVVAGVLAQVALVPFVLRHELPRFGFERAAGLEAPRIWRAKLWLARFLALPPLALGVAVLGSVPQPGQAYGLAALELLLAAWVVSSLIGVATFEIADRPLLGLIFGALVALAFASLMIFYRQFLPFWLIGYFIVAGAIADRATHRVRFTEVIR